MFWQLLLIDYVSYAMIEHCNTITIYLVLVEQYVDASQIFAIVITLQLTLKVFQPHIQSGAALCKELCPVSIKQALSFGLCGTLQLLPLTL